MKRRFIAACYARFSYRVLGSSAPTVYTPRLVLNYNLQSRRQQQLAVPSVLEQSIAAFHHSLLQSAQRQVVDSLRQHQPLPQVAQVVGVLPGRVSEYYFRGDSVCHESGLVNWLRNERRPGGPPARIGFAISARMTESLHAAIQAVAEAEWGRLPPSESLYVVVNGLGAVMPQSRAL